MTIQELGKEDGWSERQSHKVHLERGFITRWHGSAIVFWGRRRKSMEKPEIRPPPSENV